jgi:protein SCO1/2
MKRKLLYLLYGFLALFVVSAILFKVFQPIQVVPRIRLAPGFSMVDQNGNRLTNEDLRGKFVLYNFFYTRCPEPCHNLNKTMKEVQSRIQDLDLGGIPVQFITISFDPDFDTPERLREYAESQNVNPKIWKFVTTGDKDILKQIIGAGFEAFYNQEDDGNYNFDSKFVLVDGWGIIRGEYRYQTLSPDTDRIVRHIQVLANEVRKSHGSAALAYEAAHFFLCYSP